MLHFFKHPCKSENNGLGKIITKLESIECNIKRYERNADKSQSNAKNITEIIKYKLSLNLKVISLPIAYLFL